MIMIFSGIFTVQMMSFVQTEVLGSFNRKVNCRDSHGFHVCAAPPRTHCIQLFILSLQEALNPLL